MIPVVLCCSFLLAAAPAVSNSSMWHSHGSPNEDETAQVYESGVRLLRAGKDLERAILRLQTAAKQEPANADFQSALACAYASRFASVAVAVRQKEPYEDLARLYDINKKSWEDDQKDPQGKLYGLPAPVPPSPPSTLDDGKPFIMDLSAARKELLRLGHRAVDAFDRARELADQRMKSDRSRLEYARGWGLFLLRQFGEGWVLDVRPRGQEAVLRTENGPLAIPPADVVECFIRCVEADADDADDAVRYRYSLALARAPKLLSWFAGIAGERKELGHTAEEMKAASDELARVLESHPLHRGALYALGLLYMESEPNRAADYLERAARAGRDNAVAWYQASEARFRQAEREQGQEAEKATDIALKLAERGNRSTAYSANRMDIPAPQLLAKAWEAAEAYGIPDGYLAGNFSWRIMDAARDAEKQGDLAKAASLDRLLCGCALQILSAMDGRDLDTRLPHTYNVPKLRRMMGSVYFITGYKSLTGIERKQPDLQIAEYLASQGAAYERAKLLDRIPY